MEDVIIIGAGPAGLSAAIYTARAGLKTLVIGILEKSNAYKAHIFENYPGFKKQITGASLMRAMLAQAKNLGAKFLSREIVDIARKEASDGGYFLFKDTEQEEHRSKFAIICSGLGFKPSGIKNEKEFTGKGVSFCACCDGPFFKNKRVAVIGNADFAGSEALCLTIYTDDVTVLSHGQPFLFSSKIQRGIKEKNIKFLKTSKIQSFEGSGKLEKIKFTDGKEMAFDGAFLALGAAAAADFANKLGLRRFGPQNAYIVAEPRTGATNIPGVFAAGDATGGNAQAVKSAGEGCNAAISVIKLLKGLNTYVDYQK